MHEYADLVREIIKTCPGYRGNEDLLEEMVSETLNRAQSFIEGSEDESGMSVYLKKIAATTVVNIAKDADSIREAKNQEIPEFQEIETPYETDDEGKIVFNGEIPPIQPVSRASIKEKLSAKQKQIFDLRFSKGMKHTEMAKELKISEKEAINELLEVFEVLDDV